MNSIRHALLLAIPAFLIFSTITPPSTFADGKFFARVNVTTEPGIAAQRAFIAFRDGKQTLIVQSDINGAGESFGWLLPLPANPTAIEAAPTYCLQPLSEMFRPRLITDRSGVLIPSLYLYAAIAIIALQQLWLKSTGKPHRLMRGLNFCALLIGALIVASFAIPTLGPARALNESAAVELQSKRAGVYDVTVITGDNVKSINTWLQENGFRSHARADAAIKDYIRDGWCFLAAKVRSDIDGPVTQHPLQIEFPTKQAIYPMRLTGTDGVGVRLDLFVVADQQAEARYMSPWFCDAMKRNDKYLQVARDTEYDIQAPPAYMPRKHRRFQPVALPAVSDAMWDGCVLTHLHGRFTPDQMRDDLLINQVNLQAGIAAVHSQSAAWQVGGSYGALMATLVCLLLAIGAERKNIKWQTFLKKRLPLSILCGAALAAGVYLKLDVVPVEITNEPAFLARIMGNDHWRAIEEMDEKPNATDFIATYQQHLRPRTPDDNPIVSDRNQLEAPGDYLIEATETGWELSFVDGNFTPITVTFDKDGKPTRMNSVRHADILE